MRILSLRLIAFGAFEDREIDLGRRPSALSIVYGPNEAGKSTSLRALEGLLFGIDSTDDAHRHAPRNLRVGGTIEASSGEILRVVRRRGLKGTLRDDKDEVIDEAPLRALLRGIDREMFRTLYGLDHERLREGARALLSSKSSLSESLFDAGLAGAGVARLLESLRAQAEAIFAPRATARPLNEALRAFGQSQKNARTFAMPAAKHELQLQAVREAAARRAKADEELRALDHKRRRLERARRVGPLLARRRALLREREGLRDAVLLPESATEERERAVLQRDEAEALLATHLESKKEIERARALVDETRIGLDASDAIETLSRLIGECREGARLGALQVERVRLAEKAKGERERSAVDPAAEQKLLEAVSLRDEARGPLAKADEELAELLRVRASVAATAGAPDELDLARYEALRVATTRAEQALARDPELEAARLRAAALGRDEEALLARVGSSRSADDLLRVVPLEPEQLEAIEGRRADARAKLEHARAKIRAIEAEEERLQGERRAVLASGDVLSTEALREARAQRDDALAQASRDASALLEAFARVRDCDDLADRMLREADKSARLRALAAALEEQARALAPAREEEAHAASREASAARELVLALERAGAPSTEPEAARGFFRRHAAFVDARRSADAARRAQGELEAARQRALEALIEAGISERDLAPAIARARGAIQSFERAAVERERAAAKLEELDARIGQGRARRERAREASARAEAVADAALEAAALPRGLTKDALVFALAAAREGADAQARVVVIDAEIERLARTEQRLVSYCETIDRALGKAPAKGDPLARAEILSGELRRAEVAEREARELDRRAHEIDARIRDDTARAEAARAAIESYVARAKVDAEAELPAAEGKSARARALDAELERIEDQIRVAADGAPVEALEAELASFDAEQAELEEERLEEERDALERERDKAAQDRVGSELALKELEGSQAADHAAEAQIHLARCRSLAHRYARLRLAAAVLERQIETYRKLHQAPVLARAQEHFARLSAGSFTELRVVMNEREQPELVCVRSGEEVPIEGLSDGAKDQLFLALRLATIERHTEHVESMPLVLDDVLVNFDEDRAKAALQVLASLTPRMQVLLFTHQERIVEIAQETLEEGVQVVGL